MASLPRYAIPLAAAMLAAGVALVVASVPDAPQPAASRDVRILLSGDPFAAILEQEASAIAGTTASVRFERAGYDATREAVLNQARTRSGTFDLVAFDVVWTAELAEAGALEPLDGVLANHPEVDPGGILEAAMAGMRWRGRTWGLPIQPHSELLWGRTDLLSAAGLGLPATPDDLVAAARALHRPAEGVYGIVWNAQRGSALGQTMAHFYAAFGQRLLDDRGRPALTGTGGIQAARLALALRDHSPPDILTTAWDQRRRRFMAGEAALTFEWGARFGEGLRSPECRVVGRVACAPPPRAPGVAPVAAFGTWCLGIPAGVRDREAAGRLLAAICGPDGARRLAAAGNAGVPRRDLLTDEILGSRFANLFPVMRELDRTGAFNPHVRPASPHWDGLCRVMGEVFHDMLRGELTPEAAVDDAQRRASALWDEVR